MSLHAQRLIIGAALSYCLDGSAITNTGGSVTSGVSVKPDGTTAGDWKTFGTVEKANIKVGETKEEIFAPSPGAYRRIEQLRTSQMTDLAITIQEVQELVLQSLLRSGSITDSTSFTPGSTLGEIRGWFRLQKYSQRDNLVLDWQFYAVGTVRAMTVENKSVKPEFDLALLWNSLESGKSTLAAA